MDYLFALTLLSVGLLVMVNGQGCPDQSILQNCLKNLQAYEKSLNLFTDKDSLESECRTFDESMKCVDEYLDKCDKKEEIESKLTNLRNAINNICNNQQLKEDLLYNKECYETVSSRWDECTKELQAQNNKDLCMVRDTVIKCSHNLAVKSCSESAAKSVCRTTTTLLSMLVPSNTCKTDGIEMCSSGFTMQPTILLLLSALALLVKSMY